MQQPESEEELYYRVALSFVPGIGSKSVRVLLERFTTAKKVFEVSLRDLRNVEGITEARARGFKDKDIFARTDREMKFIRKHQVRVLLHGYPKRLTNCTDAPTLLYYRGNADLDMEKSIAIVGTRRNTDYGAQVCEELVDALSGLENVVVVSGLALGIDAIAHRRSLQVKVPTVGVLGHGLDRIYPFNHKSLAEQMVEEGGLLTEFPSETIPDRGHFPARNRIVAGLSDVTVLVESSISGGALITALMANGYNREVAAYPGRVTDAQSAGCNEIIRTNHATLINKPEDLIDLMQWGEKRKAKPVQRQLFIELSAAEQKVFDLLNVQRPVHSDELLSGCQLGSSVLAATLLQLEMQGLVRSLPGKYYKLV